MCAAPRQSGCWLALASRLRDPLAGQFRLGVIPTLAPYLCR